MSSLNTIRAILILNAKSGPKKGSAKAKGWTDAARAKAALTRKAKANVAAKKGAKGLKTPEAAEKHFYKALDAYQKAKRAGKPLKDLSKAVTAARNDHMKLAKEARKNAPPVPKTLGFDNRYGKLKDHNKHYQEVLKPKIHEAISKDFKLGTFSADRKKLRLVPKEGSDVDRVNVYFKGTHPVHGYPLVEASAYKKRAKTEADRVNAISHLVGGSFLGSMFAGMPDGEGKGNPNSPNFQEHLRSAIDEAQTKMREQR